MMEEGEWVKKVVFVFALTLWAIGAARASDRAIDPGVAKGTLQVGDETIELKYAYVYRCDNEEELLDGPELRVLLADREIDHEILAGFDGPERVGALAKEGSLRGILLKFDLRKPVNESSIQSLSQPTTQLSGTLLFPPPGPQASLIFFTSSGGETLRSLQSANNRVSGEVQYQSREEQVTKDTDDFPRFKFSSTFDAPLFQDEKVTANLIGGAAVRSAPAQAMLAFERAIRSGDFASVQKLVTDDKWSEIQSYRAQAGETAFRTIINQMIPPTAQRTRDIKRVVIRGSRAVILLQDNGGKTGVTVALVDKVWKIE
jgi:hypothetical protein